MVDWTGRTSLLVMLSWQDGENTQLTIAPCTVMIGMGCKDTNRESVWIAGAQDEEDPWEYNIAPRKGLVTRSVRGVHTSVQELSYLRMILKNDGVTFITAVERTVQGKKDSRQPE